MGAFSSALDFVQITHTDYEVTLANLLGYRDSESWWGYQSVTFAFSDIVSKAQSIEMAESACKYSGLKEGRPHNVAVARLIFETYKGTGAKAVPLLTKPAFVLRQDLWVPLRPAGLIRRGNEQEVVVLIARTDPVPTTALSYLHWLYEEGLSVTRYAGLPIKFMLANRFCRRNGIAKFLTYRELPEIPTSTFETCNENFIRAYDYLESRGEQQESSRNRKGDSHQGKLF